jgi:hypothetical protein
MDHVTIVLAEGGDAKAEDYARRLTDLGGTPFTVISRDNGGLSYGSWNFAYDVFGDDYSHYAFVEDDYIPCREHLKDELLSICEAKKSYTCALSGRGKTHAAISNAIVSTLVLQKVHPAPIGHLLAPVQTIWSKHFADCGFPIEDWTDTHSSPFAGRPEIRWYGHPRLPPMFVPIHAVGVTASIWDGKSPRVTATIEPDGSVRPSTAVDATRWESLLQTDADDRRWLYPCPE